MTDSMYQHAAFYRMLHHGRSEDLEFYLSATQGCGTVLEYGVGSGRVALPMARRGQRVVGVDLSEDMLASLREDLAREEPEVRQRLTLVHANARQLELPERFDAVTCPFNGIAHHHDHAELSAFLARVRSHLRPGGVFVLDVSLPDPPMLAGMTGEVPWFRDPVDGTVCRATEQVEYDALTQVLTITTTTRAMETEREPITMELRLRQLFPQETELLLRHHGFTVVQRELDLPGVIGYVCRVDAEAR
ncbi:MAG: class I SAM-dependent methyltransferase [Nannocystaceae bacterium]